MGVTIARSAYFVIVEAGKYGLIVLKDLTRYTVRSKERAEEILDQLREQGQVSKDEATIIEDQIAASCLPSWENCVGCSQDTCDCAAVLNAIMHGEPLPQ